MAESTRSQRALLLFWLFVIVFAGYLSYGYIRAKMRDDQLASYLDYLVQSAGNENRPAGQVRDLVAAKAAELDLAIPVDQIRVSGARQTLRVSLSYDVDIRFPGLERILVHRAFDHAVAYHELR